MNVAVDTNCILPGKVGGIENYTVALIEALQGRASPATRLMVVTRPENHERFAHFAGDHTTVAMLDRPAVRWDTMPAHGRRIVAHAKRAMLDRFSADVIHFPGNTINPIDVDRPTVLNLHDLQHRHFPHYFTPAEIGERETWWAASARRADAMIAASDYVRDDLVTQLGIPPAKIFVTPDPVEAAFKKPATPQQIAAVRMKFSIVRPFLIYPAAYWPHKNHEGLLAAFKAAAVDCDLVLTGGGQNRRTGVPPVLLRQGPDARATDSSLADSVDSLQLGDRVHLLGRVDTPDLVALYHAAIGMVCPSRHESWSIPVAEAMACGCPVACSNVTSLPQQVGDAGILFDPDDTTAMAAAIRTLATDPLTRRILTGRGHIRAAATGDFIATISSAYRFAIGQFQRRAAA